MQSVVTQRVVTQSLQKVAGHGSADLLKDKNLKAQISKVKAQSHSLKLKTTLSYRLSTIDFSKRA